MEGQTALSDTTERSSDLPDWARQFNTSRNVTEARRKADAYRIDTYIAPHFARRALSNIRTADIEQWIENLLDQSVGAATIHASLLLVRQVLDLALDRGIIQENPARGVQVPGMAPTRQPTDQEILTEEQLQSVLSHVDPYFRAFVLFTARTGARWEEATGLQMEDLLLDDRLVRLGARRVVADPSARLRLVTDDALANVRLVPLTDDLVDELTLYLRMTEQLHSGPHDLVFVSKRAHTLLVSTNFSRFVLRPALEAAGLDPQIVTFHSLRHTAAVRFIREGNPIERIQRWLGHRKIMSTYRTYARFFAEMGVPRPTES